MIYIDSGSNDPSYNIAFEEYAFEVLSEKEDVFYLWINSPCIVVGKNQNTIEEVNRKYTEEHGIRIVRRRSGGGAVYHDKNTINYTIITRKGREEAFDFKAFSIPVIEYLKTLGVDAYFSGRNDLLIDDQKFCGNAQMIRGDKIMHHGCMLFDTDLGVLQEALCVDSEKYESKGKKSVRSRVCNLKSFISPKTGILTMENFKEGLKEYMMERTGMKEYFLREEELQKVLELKKNRNDNPAWVYGENPPFTVKNKKRYPFGTVEILMEVEKGVLKDLHFYGDFFGVEEIDDLTACLKGSDYEKGALRERLKDIDLSLYIHGMEKEELINLLTD